MLKFAITTALALGITSSAFAKAYSGDYTVQFYIDPGHTTGSAFCLALTETGTIAGFSNVDRVLVTAARSMGASNYQLFRHVLMPAASPVPRKARLKR